MVEDGRGEDVRRFDPPIFFSLWFSGVKHNASDQGSHYPCENLKIHSRVGGAGHPWKF